METNEAIVPVRTPRQGRRNSPKNKLTGTLAQEIRHKRLVLKEKVKDLASAYGVSTATISKVVSGKLYTDV